MAIITATGLSFSYQQPHGKDPLPNVLDGVNLVVEEGAFCVITGPTGCGKSTLLRLLKPQLAPRGNCSGELMVDGVALIRDKSYLRSGTSPSVAFVSQDPDAQIVCDTVRAELAFGLENQGIAPAEMTRRMAEASGFLGIDSWMSRQTAQLSGGEKQLLNVASALALQPRVLLLDEPTAQLDPYAQRRLLSALASINDELGITILVASHSPELMRPMATQLYPLQPLPALAQRKSVHIRQDAQAGETALSLQRVSFRYNQREAWIVDDATLSVSRGQVHALIGGNGSGKTTLMKLAAGILKPTRGHRTSGSLRQAYLPQAPKSLFACDTVREELHEWHRKLGYSVQDEQRIASDFGLEPLFEQHPYDVSGGQQQKLALAKLLLGKPQVLFLDEPTKGLDAESAAALAAIICRIADDDAAVMLATHDTAFIQAVANTVSLVFDGSLACTLPTQEFFANSLVYRENAKSRLFGALQS